MDFQEIGWKRGLDSCGREYGQVAGYFEYGNNHVSSIECVGFLAGLVKSDFSTWTLLHRVS
jgi:hypothetical protein